MLTPSIYLGLFFLADEFDSGLGLEAGAGLSDEVVEAEDSDLESDLLWLEESLASDLVPADDSVESLWAAFL